MKASDRIAPRNMRLDRANQLVAIISDMAEDVLKRTDHPADFSRTLHTRLLDYLHDEGAEIITDRDRDAAGLAPRGLEGWTAEELRALELHRMEVMLRPMPPVLFVDPSKPGQILPGPITYRPDDDK